MDTSDFRILSIALPIVLLVWYANWTPTNLFVVGEIGNNHFVSHYYVLYDDQINGKWLFKNGASNYIYNASQTVLSLEKHNYGRGNDKDTRDLINPNQLFISQGEPTYFFEPVPHSVNVRRNELTYTIWAINKYEKKVEWNFEEAKRKAAEGR